MNISIYIFPNGMVAVCDEHGKQMPDLQGPAEEAIPAIQKYLERFK